MEELYEYRRRLIERFRTVAEDLAAVLETSHPADLNTSREGVVSKPEATIAHLFVVESSIFIPYLHKILDEELPCLEDTQSVQDALKESELSTAPLTVLEKFQQLHTQQVNLLLGLPLESWSRCGRHGTYGVRTFQWWVEHCLAHAEAHLRPG